jgi:hypothetical protein
MSEKKKEKPMAAEVPEADTVEGGEEVAAEKEEGAEEPEPEVEVEPEAEIEVEELPESLKPYKDAVALLRVWSSAFATGILQQPLLALGERYLLPATAPVKALLCLVAKMTGLDEAALAADVFGEQAWDPIRKVLNHLQSATDSHLQYLDLEPNPRPACCHCIVRPRGSGVGGGPHVPRVAQDLI